MFHTVQVRAHYLPLLLAATLTGCSSEPVHVESPKDGTPVTAIGGEALQNPADLTFSEIFRISGSEHGFALLIGVEASNEGIVTADQILNQVMVFDTAGQLVSIFGGQGDGPGELRRPAHLAATGDTVYVIDQNGLNLFLSNGEFVRRSPINSEAAGGTTNFRPYPQSLAHDGIGLITSFHMAGRSKRSYPAVDSTSIHRIGHDGTVESPFTYAITAHIHKLGGGMYGLPLFLGGSDFTVGSDSTVYVALQSSVDIDLLRGGARKRIHLGVERRGVLREDIESLIEAVKSHPMPELGDEGNRARELAFETSPISRYRSVIGRVVSGAGGLLLLRRNDLSPVNVLSSEAVTWDLVTSEGGVIGRLRLPSTFQPHVVERGRIVGVVVDSSGVPSISALLIGGGASD